MPLLEKVGLFGSIFKKIQKNVFSLLSHNNFFTATLIMTLLMKTIFIMTILISFNLGACTIKLITAVIYGFL